MMRFAIRFIFLVSLHGAGAAFAQTSTAHLMEIPDTAWVNVDFGDDLSTTDGGLQILAQNAGDNTPSAMAVGRHRYGIGAAGAQASAPAIKAETGFDPVLNRSEKIIVSFEHDVVSARLDLSCFYRNEAELAGVSYHEHGGWRAYRGDILIGQGSFLPDSPDGAYRLVIAARVPFDRLELFATPYVTESGAEIEPGLITTDSSDFLIKRIAYQPAGETHISTLH